MTVDDAAEYLPVSMLNQWAYCPRRFYYMYVLGELDVNAPVLEGMLQHERVHEACVEREGETRIHRRVYVWSDRLGVA
ncbi:MAG: CRISPR-associated protein Cas4, partial [Bacillota bacterium]